MSTDNPINKDPVKRTQQCEKCPWRQSVNPFDIPDDYSLQQHKALASTIADPNNPIDSLMNPTPVMSCHEHRADEQVHCVGYLHNQLTTGNNVGLRYHLMKSKNIAKLKLRGKQHATFKDTIPNE